jgi:two-component system sensor histidine kinase BaeS
VRNTSHDVMIPLTVLQGDLSDLRRRIERGESPDRERVVQALEEAHYMGSLLHNLSAVAKLEGADHQLQMHPVDLNALVQRASERHRPMAHMRGIELEYGVPEPVLLTRGDLTLIEQAVSNVIHNAVRYNEEGGHVAVILEAPRDRPGIFSIQVIDDGPGIAPEDMERIAERRFRGEAARTRHPDGSGLGLNIARDVAERHGMQLEFRASDYDGLAVELSGSLLAGAEGGG